MLRSLFQIHAFQHDVLRQGIILCRRRLDGERCTVGDSAFRCLFEVPVEVIRGDVRERAEAHSDTGDSQRLLFPCDGFNLSHQVVDEGELVHGYLLVVSCWISRRTRSATSPTARETSGESDSPAAKFAPSIP